MHSVNRQWRLVRRPVGTARVSDMEFHESDVPDASALGDGQILVRTSVFLHAPTMRNWMDEPGNNYYPSVPLGAPMLATCAGTVVASRDARFSPGDRVTTIGSWQDYAIVDANVMPVRPVRPDVSLVQAMGPLGMNALTAYIGRPEAGDVLVVSGAAGSTGSVAGQIGKIMGCRVIGIAGSTEKCNYLTQDLRFDAAINYREANVEQQIRALAPAGVNIFFDNVGGEILQAAVENIAKYGVIVLCGQIAGYDNSEPISGPRNMMRLVYCSVRMQGFLLGDFEDDIPAATDQLWQWLSAGKIAHREDVREGFESLTESFGDLSKGLNDGTLLVVTNSQEANATSV